MRKIKRKINHNSLLSGVLNSPYGKLKVGMGYFYNGHAIVNGRLKNVSAEHHIPEHWIKTEDRHDQTI